MKLTWSTVFGSLLSCLFTGVIIIAIGLGSVFPPIERVSKPFVCPNGEMEYEQQVYRPTPVETVTTTTWYCVEQSTGARRELGVFPMSLYAGAVYGLLLFPLSLIGLGTLGRRAAVDLQALRETGSPRAAELLNRLGGSTDLQETTSNQVSGTAVARMTELKALREANLISEAEYEEKRAEILRGV